MVNTFRAGVLHIHIQEGLLVKKKKKKEAGKALIVCSRYTRISHISIEEHY